MDDQRVQEIRERLAAAVPGPWVLSTHSDYPQRIVANNDGLVLVAETYTDPSWSTNDADLIAHAPTDLADLLDERDRLLAVVEAAEQVERARTGPLSSLVAALWLLNDAVRAYRAATTGEAGQ